MAVISKRFKENENLGFLIMNVLEKKDKTHH